MKHLVIVLGMLFSLALAYGGVEYDTLSVLKSGKLRNGDPCIVSFSYPLFLGDAPLAKALNAHVNRKLNHPLNSDFGVHFDDYEALAQNKVDAWLKEHDDEAFCEMESWQTSMEEQIRIDVQLNKKMVTLHTYSYGRSGFGHGADTDSYQMFSPEGDSLDHSELIKPEARDQFNRLLRKYHAMQDVIGDEGGDFVITPYDLALTEEGLLVIYDYYLACSFYHMFLIPRVEIIPLLTSRIRNMYQ